MFLAEEEAFGSADDAEGMIVDDMILLYLVFYYYCIFEFFTSLDRS